MTKKMEKVNLELIKKLVLELENTLSVAEKIKENLSDKGSTDYIVELSKAAGLATGIMQEGSALVMDVLSLTGTAQSPLGKQDLLEKILGPLKGPGSNWKIGVKYV